MHLYKLFFYNLTKDDYLDNMALVVCLVIDEINKFNTKFKENTLLEN